MANETDGSPVEFVEANSAAVGHGLSPAATRLSASACSPICFLFVALEWEDAMDSMSSCELEEGALPSPSLESYEPAEPPLFDVADVARMPGVVEMAVAARCSRRSLLAALLAAFSAASTCSCRAFAVELDRAVLERGISDVSEQQM